MATIDDLRRAQKDLEAKLRKVRKLTRGSPLGAADRGAEHRGRMARRSREASESVAEIGPIPPPADPDRRAACEFDLERYLVSYFPNSTGLSPLSDDHRRVIRRMQHVILHGGRALNAVYRGFAKTTISENAALWATFYGHRPFVPIFGANARAAREILDSIKMELDCNDLLLADFPEICLPILAVGGKVQRCDSQTHMGRRTFIEWSGEGIVLPTIYLSDEDHAAGRTTPASGAVIKTAGLTAASRGTKHKTPDGTNHRCAFAIVDDPQTDRSAASIPQTESRMKVIHRAILQSGGHDTTFSAVINATPIEPGDLVYQLLTLPEHVAWQGERIPMVKRMPDALDKLWLGRYAEIRRRFDRTDPNDRARAIRQSTEYYRDHRAEMDAGAEVSWEHCYEIEHEVSAIQHAINILIDDGEDVFSSECQMEPLEDEARGATLDADAIAGRQNHLKRYELPVEATHLTAFLDVHDKLLYYVVRAWEPNFTGYVVDYGAWPDQKSRHFTMRSCRRTLLAVAPKGAKSRDAAIYHGLGRLVEQLLTREWQQAGGASLSIGKLLIDSGYKTDLVYRFCRAQNTTVVMPSKGVSIRAANKPFSEYERRPGEIYGEHWRVIPSSRRADKVRVVHVDTNYWKSRVHAGFAAPTGEPGAATLWKARVGHRLFGEHLNAQYSVRTQGRERTVDEWFERPHHPDDHLFDCDTGCHVGASLLGVRLPGTEHEGRMRPARRARPTLMQLAGR